MLQTVRNIFERKGKVVDMGAEFWCLDEAPGAVVAAYERR